MTRAGIACLVLFACEKAHQPPPPPPPVPRDASADAPHDSTVDGAPRDSHFKIVYAARTDNAADDTNTTFFNLVEDEAFFVIADAGDASTSKSTAELMGELFATACHDVADDEAQVRCVLDRTVAKLVLDHRRTSIAAVIVRGNQALVARAGDTPVVWRHGGALEVFDTTSAPLGVGPPKLQWIELGRGDTLVIVNKRLLDVVGKDALRGATPEHEIGKDELAARIEALLATGRRLRRPTDAVTAVAIHLIHPGP